MAAVVVVVEDNEELRDTLRDVLVRAGYDVECAPDGVEGMELLGRIGIPSLLLVDLWMPRLDGRGFVRALRELPAAASLPVILMSGDVVRGIEGVRVIRKPVDPDVLLDLVRECVAAAENVAHGMAAVAAE